MPIHSSLLRNPSDVEFAGRRWCDVVQERARKRVDAAENMLVGATAICRYMKISHIGTLKRWVIQYGFPAFRNPDGVWVSAITAIDEWIWIASELERESQLAVGAAKAAKRAAGFGQSAGRTSSKRYSSKLADRQGPEVAAVQGIVNTMERERMRPIWNEAKQRAQREGEASVEPLAEVDMNARPWADDDAEGAENG
jgi:hypothetical protein